MERYQDRDHPSRRTMSGCLMSTSYERQVALVFGDSAEELEHGG